jgi:hypothetical protein
MSQQTIITTIKYTLRSRRLGLATFAAPRTYIKHHSASVYTTLRHSSSHKQQPRRINKMKENYTELYPNEQVGRNVGDYSAAHSTPLPKHITDYHAKGSEHKNSGYMISPFQAQFHLWFASAFGAKRSEFNVFHVYFNPRSTFPCSAVNDMINNSAVGPKVTSSS